MKQLTREQVQARKEKAVQFVQDVLEDADRADEIADESIEDYAERRKFQITNPKRSTKQMATKQDLEEKISELEAENEDLQSRLDEILDIVTPEDEDQEDEGEDGELGEE